MSRISGKSLLSAFDDEVRRHDDARGGIESQIAAEEKRIAEANAAREAAYADLAGIYAADGGKLAASFGTISQRLQAIFNDKMERRREVNGLMERAAGLIANLRARVTPAQEREHACGKRLEETQRVVEVELRQDEAFLAIEREAKGLRDAAESLGAAGARIREECESKRAAFQSHPLFRYLLSVKFGTPQYGGGGVAASGDRWVARLAAWEKNYPSFATLTELPLFAQKRVAEAQKRAELAAAKIAFHVSERETAHGVSNARAELTAATRTLTDLNLQTAKLETQRAAFALELQEIDRGADPFQIRAKAEMKAFLKSHPVEALKAKAVATDEPRDNALVAAIEEAEGLVNEGRRRVKALVAERAVADERHQRAIQARRRFSSGYTGGYDQFDGRVDLGNLLAGYILGSTSERLLWGHLDQHHHDATPSFGYGSQSGGGSFFGGPSFGSAGGDSGGSSFGGSSGSSFSSGGGDSGGSFSTGGGD